jgi:hypothetical protein
MCLTFLKNEISKKICSQMSLTLLKVSSKQTSKLQTHQISFEKMNVNGVVISKCGLLRMKYNFLCNHDYLSKLITANRTEKKNTSADVFSSVKIYLKGDVQ